MTFSEVVVNATIDCMTGTVPCIIGHAGVGKSQLPKAIRKLWIELNNSKKENEKLTEDDIDIVTIFGSLVKEGELGGIPVPHAVKNALGKEVMVNDYTTHVKMQKILDNDEEGKITILFIDEINRCENAVQQELMQLILDKQINQTYLPDSCAIMCAGNPEVDEYADYQVTIMNDALKNRFIMYKMDSDTDEWIKWASQPSEKNPNENNIHDDIIEFIAEFPNLLHEPKSSEEVKPTPRGVWMFSENYKTSMAYLQNSDYNFENIILNQAKGIVGMTWATSFISFLRNKENPLVKPEEILKSSKEQFTNTIIPRVRKEGPLRQFVIIDRLIKKLDKMIEEKEFTKKNLDSIGERFNDILEVIPKDSMAGVLKDISKNHRSLYDLMINIERFMDIFLNTVKMASQH